MGANLIQQYRVSEEGQCRLSSSFVECAIMTGLEEEAPANSVPAAAKTTTVRAALTRDCQ
ncbi:hypothetical protein QJS10_CPB15g00872 [Acorus calamus]|uniref:Uncharacterized protein n=1 Tax=Acorus calamus TaxID=4465 RepID=A0AAV9D9S2_ACOCL|nr:hypothetical protein QJS10_CPB15g00872 [Acorus calamus]